jgi:hypothetical protein
MAKLLVIFEKIVLTDGMMVGGRKPATTIANVAHSRAYSIMSWPCSSLHSRVNISSARIELLQVFPALPSCTRQGVTATKKNP